MSPATMILDPSRLLPAAEKYQPSNGTEGEGFLACWCMECERDRKFWEEDGDGCDIVARSMAFNKSDAEYPAEWIVGVDGHGLCTAFLPIGAQLPTDLEMEAAGQLIASLLAVP